MSDEEGRPDTSCEICIVNTNSAFKPVDEELDKETFTKWWPTAARAVISGMFANCTEDRDRAASHLMPMLEQFRKTSGSRILPPATFGENTGVKQLSELLSTRLVFEQQIIQRVCTHWIQRVQEFYERATAATQRHKHLLRDLTDRAVSMAKKYPTEESFNIIQNQALLFSQRARHEHELDIRSLRIEILSGPDPKTPDIRQLDTRIRELMREQSSHSAPEIEALKMIHHSHVATAEYNAAKEVQEMCRKYWIRAL